MSVRVHKPVRQLPRDERSNQDANIVDGGGQWRLVGFVAHQVPLWHTNTTQHNKLSRATHTTVNILQQCCDVAVRQQ